MQLQGASFLGAQLQGASFQGATIKAADFAGAFLWRTQWGEIDPKYVGAVQLDPALERWKPVWQKESFSPLASWDAQAYAELRVSMNSIPEGKMRDEALKRIEILDCENPNKTLVSCDPAAAPPPEVLNWQKTLLNANVDDAGFAKAIATELRERICANDSSAIHVLRGAIKSGRLGDADREAPALVDFIMSKDCPVSASLTDDDKAKLLQIKQDAEKESAPPPASKEEN